MKDSKGEEMIYCLALAKIGEEVRVRSGGSDCERRLLHGARMVASNSELVSVDWVAMGVDDCCQW